MEHIKMSYKIENKEEFSVYLDNKTSENDIIKIALICDKYRFKFNSRKDVDSVSTLNTLKDHISAYGSTVLNIHSKSEITISLCDTSVYSPKEGETYIEYLNCRHIRHNHPECFFIGDCDFELD